jgi:hypothetical protein
MDINCKSFNEHTVDGKKNTADFKDLRSIMRMHKGFYITLTVASFGISLTGYFATGSALFLALIVVAELSKIMLYPSKRAVAKPLLLVMISVSLFSGSIGMTVSQYTKGEQAKNRESVIESKKERIVFLRAELKKPITVGSGTSQYKSVSYSQKDLIKAQKTWFKYQNMRMRDWTSKNRNGRKGKRSGQWMVEHRSQCKTSWCGKVIDYYTNYQALVVQSKRAQDVEDDKRAFIKMQAVEASQARSQKVALMSELGKLEQELTNDISTKMEKPFFEPYQMFMIMVVFLLIVEALQWYASTVISANTRKWSSLKYDWKYYNKFVAKGKRGVGVSKTKTTNTIKPTVSRGRKKTLNDEGVKLIRSLLKESGEKMTKATVLRLLEKHNYGKTKINVNQIIEN